MVGAENTPRLCMRREKLLHSVQLQQGSHVEQHEKMFINNDSNSCGEGAYIASWMALCFATICPACLIEAMSMSLPSRETAPRPSRCASSMAFKMRFARVT